MLPPHLNSMTSRAQEAKNEKALRALLKQPDNSRCFNCGTRVCSDSPGLPRAQSAHVRLLTDV